MGNKYEPFPEWFEKYGAPDSLEKWPHGDALKQTIVDTIKLYREKVKYETRECNNCGMSHITKKTSKVKCPFCRAPPKYNLKKIKGWFMK